MANWSGTFTNSDSIGFSTGFNSALSLNDTTASWPDLTNQMVRIISGLGVGQERLIQSNTATTIIITAMWDTIPDVTSEYEIVLLLKNDDHITGTLIINSGMITELEDSATIYLDGNYSIQFQNSVICRWNKTKETYVTFEPNQIAVQGKTGFWLYIYFLANCTNEIKFSFIKLIDSSYGILNYLRADLSNIHHIWTKHLANNFFARSSSTDNSDFSMSFILNEGTNASCRLSLNSAASIYTEKYERVWSENCLSSGIVWGSLNSSKIQIVKNAIFKNAYQSSATNIRGDADKRIFLIDGYFSTMDNNAVIAQGSNVDTMGKTYISRNVSMNGREVLNTYAHAMSITSRFNDFSAIFPLTYWAFDVTAATEITSDNDYIAGRLQADTKNIDISESTTSTENPQQYRGLTSVRTNAKSTLNKLLEIDNVIISNIQADSADITFDCKNSHAGTVIDQNSNLGQKIVYVSDTTEFEEWETIEIGFGTVRAEEGVIDSIQAGISVTLKENLTNTHTALDADTVRKQLRNWGLPFIRYGKISAQYDEETPVPDKTHWGAIFCEFESDFFEMTFEWKKWGHSISLTNLNAGTDYYIQCCAYTPFGEIMVSSEFNFTTSTVEAYTDPGIDNVRDGTTYKFDNIEKTGIMDLPIPFDVRDGVFYDNGTKEGTLDLPLEIDVRLGTVYDNGTKTGELQAGISQADIDKIAIAVWDEPVADHIDQDTFGGRDQRKIGMMQENFRLYDTSYLNELLQSGKIRIYSSASDVDTDTNPIATYQINATYSGNELDEYKVKKI